MAAVLRGDVRWAALDPVRGSEQGGRRPVLVLSDDLFNERSQTVIAMVVTSQPPRAGYPLNYELVGIDLPKRSWVKITQVRTLAVERLGGLLGRATARQMVEIVDGLNEIIAA
jgi:mRNA interferase MazF